MACIIECEYAEMLDWKVCENESFNSLLISQNSVTKTGDT
jgi:hypothetical protein